MTSHCAGTVQMREESESGIRKWEEMWFKTTAEDGERERQQWRAMEDCSTDERLRQETLCHRQWTDEYVERPETLMRQNVVVVWIQCLLVDVVRHTGTLAPDHVDICMPKLWPYRQSVQRSSASEVGKAAGWCGWTSTTRMSAWWAAAFNTDWSRWRRYAVKVTLPKSSYCNFGFVYFTNWLDKDFQK